jgi:hypothetical protein
VRMRLVSRYLGQSITVSLSTDYTSELPVLHLEAAYTEPQPCYCEVQVQKTGKRPWSSGSGRPRQCSPTAL